MKKKKKNLKHIFDMYIRVKCHGHLIIGLTQTGITTCQWHKLRDREIGAHRRTWAGHSSVQPNPSNHPGQLRLKDRRCKSSLLCYAWLTCCPQSRSCQTASRRGAGSSRALTHRGERSESGICSTGMDSNKNSSRDTTSSTHCCALLSKTEPTAF